MTDVSLPAALDVRMAAQLLRMSPRSVYRAIASGDLPSVRLGGRVLIPTATLLVMLGVSRQRAEGSIAFPTR